VMGIVEEICSEWSKTVVGGGIAPVYFAAFFSALVYFIFWNGKTEFFERALAVIVAIMGACFLLNFFIMLPPPMTIIAGMIPNLPEVPADAGKGPFLVIASMVGTTVFSGLFIIRTTLVMIVSQALSSVLLPLTVGCIFYLSNHRDLLKEHANKIGANVILFAIFAFSLLNSSMAIKGVFESITDLLAS